MRSGPSVLAALSCAVSIPLAAQQTSTVAVNATWGAGTVLRAPWVGVAFTVPQGFQAEGSAQAHGVVMSDGRRLMGVWAASRGTVEQLANGVGEVLHGLGIQAQLQGQPEVRGDLTVARFAASTSGGAGSLVAALRQGADGNALAVAILGEGDATPLEALAVSTARGATLGPPRAAGWTDRAAGRRLTTTGTDHLSSRGGVGDGRYNSRTTATLTLCRDGRYGYESETYSLMSVDGAGSMESTSRDDHDGRWSLVSDILGRAHLHLETGDGREFLWMVEETADGATINGSGYRAEAGPC
jgi:hypothetical protein